MRFGVKHFPSRGQLFLFLQLQLSSVSAVLFKTFTLWLFTTDFMFCMQLYATIKRHHFTPKVTWRIIRKCTRFNTTKRKCYLCLNEKLQIASYKGDNLLNKRSELICKFRHQNKFTLLRHDSKD